MILKERVVIGLEAMSLVDAQILKLTEKKGTNYFSTTNVTYMNYLLLTKRKK